jgi:hypothetical protein
VRVTDLACLRFYPNISAVLGARQADGSYACGLARQLGTVIQDDFVHAYALNTTAGVGWQLGPFTALDLDYVHSAATHQTGTTDRNLPPSGPISGTNPRPVAQFGQVLMLENFSRSWYDALETQLRARFHANGSMRVSYALSRSYLDGVDFFLTTRGTQRTPRERGYNPSDQRHNLTVAGTVALPWSLELSGVLTLVSGSPIKVQAGEDLDGDTTVTGDLPPGIPITVGRDHVDESLAAINEYRATKSLQPIDRSLLALDPYRTLDVRIAKPVRLGRQRLDVLVEAFNLTNHVNFRTNANANMNTASFLQRRAARDARQIQWGVRWLF